jgi:hypothetical protein
MMGWSEPKRYAFEDPKPKIGPGLSRPKPKESARLYRLQVKLPDNPQMIITIPAPTRGKAIMYCKNRWPGCEAEVVE